MNKIIYDETLVRKFIDEVLPNIGELEQYFVSLSCRRKYMTEEDRAKFSASNAEMFNQQLAPNKVKLFQAIRKCETHPEAFLTRDGFVYPNYAMVCYVNLFASNMVKALEEFNRLMNQNIMQLVTNAVGKKDCSSAMKAISRCQKSLVDCAQRAKGTNPYIDIDFDIPQYHKDIMLRFTDAMTSKGVSGFIVETKGGYHVLLKRETIKHNFNIDLFEAQREFAELGIKGEIANNTSNCMVSVPGTLQAGFEVTYHSF